MLHTELIPSWVWLVLVVAALATIAARISIQRKQADFNRKARDIRRHNIAEYKAWQWLHGRPKTLRLTDKSDQRDKLLPKD